MGVWPTWVARTAEGIFTPLHLGVALAIAGNLLIACSLALQKWVHLELARKKDKPCCYLPLYIALLGLIFGEAGNFAAFGLASPTVVSPLGAVAVIANALIAFLILKEEFRWRNAVGLALTVAGSVVVVLNAPPAVTDLDVESFLALISAAPSVVYFLVVLPVIGVLALAEPSLKEDYLLVDVMLCSLLGSITVLASAAVSKFLGLIKSEPDILISPVFCLTLPVLFSTAVLQLKYLNEAQKYHDSSKVVPVYYITFTVCSISGSGIVYQDFWGFQTDTALGFISGCFMCFFGVYLITKRGAVAVAHEEAAPIAANTTRTVRASSDTMHASRLRGSSDSGRYPLSVGRITHKPPWALREANEDAVAGGEQPPPENGVVDEDDTLGPAVGRQPDSPLIHDDEWLSNGELAPDPGCASLPEGYLGAHESGRQERYRFGQFISHQLDRGISGFIEAEGRGPEWAPRRGGPGHRRQMSLDRPEAMSHFVPGATTASLLRANSFGATRRSSLPLWMREKQKERLAMTLN